MTWDDFFDAPGVDLGEREQPPVQTREELETLRFHRSSRVCQTRRTTTSSERTS